jgi:hypothetical protein
VTRRKQILPLQNIKHILIAVLGKDPPQALTSQFISLCKDIATIQLRRKSNLHHLSQVVVMGSLDDLALDCIADLFYRDDAGTYPKLKTYFESLSLDSLSENEFLIHLRRLVGGRVNASLFRLYNEVDPALGKILRNIKIALHSIQIFTLSERFGSFCLTPTASETLEDLPPFDPADLEDMLRVMVGRKETIPSLLSKLSCCLREQQEHCRIVPLLTVALVFKALYLSAARQSEEEPGIEDILSGRQSQEIIREVCREIRTRMAPTYIEKKKVETEMYNLYFKVIECNLVNRLTGSEAEEGSLFNQLHACNPEISRQEYQKIHKARLEYLARLSYAKAVSKLRKDLFH